MDALHYKSAAELAGLIKARRSARSNCSTCS